MMMARHETDEEQSVNYAETFKELEKIVQQLESGQPTLEESLELFERGQELLKMCSKILDDTELKIKQLTKEEIREEKSEG